MMTTGFEQSGFGESRDASCKSNKKKSVSIYVKKR